MKSFSFSNLMKAQHNLLSMAVFVFLTLLFFFSYIILIWVLLGVKELRKYYCSVAFHHEVILDKCTTN